MKQILYKTVNHFFPQHHQWFKNIKDHRNKNLIIYEVPALIWVGMLLFLSKLGSRRQINYEFDSLEMTKNLEKLSKQELQRIPHDTTLAYFLKGLETNELPKVRINMMNSLIRKKCFEKYRCLGHYLIACDGSGYLKFNTKHCDHCLTKEKDGKVLYYYHPVMEAKLVLSNGMAFSMETEFIENSNQYVEVQDCELNAFHRLSARLKKNFPQLKICLLLDGLYANKPVMDMCAKNNWKYIITFKEGSMPAVYQEYESLKKENIENRGTNDEDGIRQKYSWALDVMQYKNTSGVNVLECYETQENNQTRFVWLTNFDITKNNFKIIGKAGRGRWKIENEGFNMQKNGGYELEHSYSENIVAMKNFYLLLQIAHIINQLIEKGSLLGGEVKKIFGSIRNLSKRLLESLRTSVFDDADIQLIEASRFQIRLQPP